MTTLLAQLPQPSTAYKRRVWLAVVGLAVFITLYFVLAGWFLYTAYRLTIGAGSAEFMGYLVGACALFLAVLMLKPLFYVERGGTEGSIEITKQQQPRLFDFLNLLADRAEAPRPHRVFLSPRVNAAVFYDLSPINLILPSKKNLEIGLALVNALSLGELRAVLAHEFGHFTQRSMAVIRWVYLAQQIAANLVARRDKLDEMLVRFSRFDVRVAWIGWLLSLVVWSIRSLVDSAFSVLLLLQRALSREMEMQADLVAVSLTGSDALVHALHRLQAADDSWDRTLNVVGEQHARGSIPRDVFPLHSRVMERMGTILSDPDYGHVPPVPAEQPEAHRLFKPELAQPPRMWLTHPLNHEREANAKRQYVSAPIDDRSAWSLFDDPVAVREQVSALMLESAGKETVPLEQSVQALDEQFGREYLNSRYRGVYLGRSVVRSAARPEMLIESPPPTWRQQLGALYPESLIEDVARVRTLDKELEQLRALHSGVLKPSEGVIRHRGRAIKRRDLPQAIQLVENELGSVELRLTAGDRLRRSVHLAAAAEVGADWASYLQGLLATLHYADHTAANLRDLQGVLAHTVHVATVTRRVSNWGRKRVLHAANELHRALADVYEKSSELSLDSSLAQRLGNGSWPAFLGKWDLTAATRENIGEWLNVIDGWVNQAAGACSALRSAALEQLLVTEAAVVGYSTAGTAPASAPSPSRIPATYDVLLAGKERERKSTLNWWQRFQIADGVVPTVARVAAAAAIVAGVLGFGATVGTATITVYNGLAVPVVVSIGDTAFRVSALGRQTHEVGAGTPYHVETSTVQGKVIEAFTPDVPGSFAHFVYNVAGATPLVEWTAIYGDARRRPERMLGAPRWTRSSATVFFESPPDSVNTSDGGVALLVVSGLADTPPGRQLAALSTDADRQRMIAAHARWDATTSPGILEWLALVHNVLPDSLGILAARLAEAPNDVVLLRVEQDAATAASKDSICVRHRAKSDAAPDDANLRYVASRCIADRPAQQQAFLDGYARWPDNGWYANAAGYTFAENGEWARALTALDAARGRLRPLAAHIAVDLARIHRLVDGDSSHVTAWLGKSSPELHYLATLESGHGLASSPMRAYSELGHGNLDKAMTLAHADSEVEARVLRLAAASDGATPDLQSRAVALGPKIGVDEYTRWASIALALRMGRDHTPFLPTDESMERKEVDRFATIINLVRRSDIAAAEQAMNGLRPSLRGQAYVIGVIVLGGKAPAAWRSAAKGLLFASERPYFN